MKCNKKTEVYSRIVGYFRPVQNWNEGKKQEFSDRVVYKDETSSPSSGVHTTSRLNSDSAQLAH